MSAAVLITGASGRLGSALATALADENFALRLTDLRPFPSEVPPGAVFEPADLADADALARMARGCRAILHFGGIPNDDAPPEAIAAANLAGVRHVYEAARLAGARVVFASSNHAMGYHARPARPDQRLDAASPYRPDGLYGLSKVYGEQMGRLYRDKHGVESVNIRIGSCTPAPADARMLATWLSPGDLARLCACAIRAPRTGWAMVWGASDNAASFWAGDDRALIGWAPRDSAEAWRDAVAGLRSGDPVAERFQGGAFASRGYSRTGEDTAGP
ncbi:NAD-dependent epimerase/dehydratase family protein [Falsiroseomonas sp. HW251]|uniref:NAD-dependent epimerase/dehydratase family protein n=1 Tax=Falsiroseomonas sp. HW251 TaxID=3390998 RepID=UPI003D31DBC5